MSFLRRLFAPNVEKLKARGNVEGLVKALSYEKDNEVRRAAALALGDIGDTGAVGPLIAALKDGQWTVRSAAAWALGDIGDTGAVEPLIAALGDAKDVREAAVWALTRIGDERAVEPVARLLEDRKRDVRVAAAEALGKMGHARAAEPLLAAIEQAGSVRFAAGRFLQYSGHEHRQSAEAVRNAATRALARIGAPVVGPLITASKHRDEHVRQAAVGLLAEIGGEHSVEALIATLKDGDKHVRRSAVQVLGKIGDRRAVKPLALLLKDNDSDVRVDVVKALTRIGDAQAVKPLIAALRDSYRIVRLDASEALAKIGTPAVEPLVAALKDGHKHVREGAFQALAKTHWQPDRSEAGAAYWAAKYQWDRCVDIGAPAVEPLIRDLKAAPMSVQRDIAAALGKIGDRRAVSPLIGTIAEAESVMLSILNSAEEVFLSSMDDDRSHYHETVRKRMQESESAEEASQAAVQALKSITGQDFGQDAARWQQWWEEQQ